MIAHNLSGLPYYGGKNPKSTTKLGKWIVSHIPWEPYQTYVEPFAGMLGVLLQRPRVSIEIVNDLNYWVINWWQVVRNYPEALADAVEHMPYSREVFKEAKRVLENQLWNNSIECAVWYTCFMVSAFNHLTYSTKYNRPIYRLRPAQIMALSDRMRYVQCENTDALKLIDRIRIEPNVICYLDPPYENANTSPYGFDVDYDAMFELLLMEDNKAKFALSGHDSLEKRFQGVEGWNRYTKEINMSAANSAQVDSSRRVECLWTNYPLTNQQNTLF